MQKRVSKRLLVVKVSIPSVDIRAAFRNQISQPTQYTCHIHANLPSWIVPIEQIGILNVPMLLTQRDFFDLLKMLLRCIRCFCPAAILLLQGSQCGLCTAHARMCRRHRRAEGKSDEAQTRGAGRAPSAAAVVALHHMDQFQYDLNTAE